MLLSYAPHRPARPQTHPSMCMYCIGSCCALLMTHYSFSYRLLLWDPQMKSHGEGERGSVRSSSMNGRWERAQTDTGTHSCFSPSAVACLTPAAVITMREEMRGGGGGGGGGGRMVVWGRQGGAERERERGREEAAQQTTKKQREEEEEEERECIHRTWVPAAEEEEEGGLPDWMGPAMPWWSMGQVLGFSHCRESAFVLLFPSVWEVCMCSSHYTIVTYSSSASFLLLTAVSIICIDSPPLPPLTLHSSLLRTPSVNTWPNGWMQKESRFLLLLLPPFDL